MVSEIFDYENPYYTNTIKIGNLIDVLQVYI